MDAISMIEMPIYLPPLCEADVPHSFELSHDEQAVSRLGKT